MLIDVEQSCQILYNIVRYFEIFALFSNIINYFSILSNAPTFCQMLPVDLQEFLFFFDFVHLQYQVLKALEFYGFFKAVLNQSCLCLQVGFALDNVYHNDLLPYDPS